MSEMGSSATEAGAICPCTSASPRKGHSVMITRSTATCQKPAFGCLHARNDGIRKKLAAGLTSARRRLLHLLHQRAFGFRQRLKCLVRRDRGNKLVIVPCPPGFRRLLHLIQIHLMGHPAVLSDLSVLGKEVVDGR